MNVMKLIAFVYQEIYMKQITKFPKTEHYNKNYFITNESLGTDNLLL